MERGYAARLIAASNAVTRMAPRRRPRRWGILLLALCGLLLLLAAAVHDRRPRLIWNASASMAVGLYRALPAGRLHRGDLVLVRLPAVWRRFAARRRYLPDGVGLIKLVAALPEETVCAGTGRIGLADGTLLPRLAADGQKRPLPSWSGCRRLDDAEVFLLAPHPASFDGRYFGPVPLRAVLARLQPIWTFDAK
jgi:type IV secretory pathway protease TraF